MSTEVVVTNVRQKTRQSGFTLANGQVLLAALLLVLGLPLLIFTVQIALFNTVLIFIFVLIAGLAFCHATHRKVHDPKLHLLKTFWLIKLGLTLFLLYAGWIPQLDPSTSSSWGYDPQRYFQDAYDLIENGWNPSVGSNYQGIIFYYGAIFYLFGHNPVIPALINAFVTLLGTLYLVRLAYEFKGERGSRDWTLAYLLLIPEVLWYDVMTSRETLTAILILVAALTAGRYIVRSSRVSFASTLLLTGISLGAILAVRTSMAIPVVAAVTLMAIVLRPRKGYGLIPKMLLVVSGMALFTAGPIVQQLTGGYNIDYLRMLMGVQSFEGNVAAQMEWGEKSLGLLLAPNNFWESTLYLSPRMVLYLAAPLPNIAVSVNDLLVGSYYAWQNLMTILTGVLNLLVLPYAMAGFAFAWKHRREQPAPLVLHFAFWMVFIAIAGGNIIIHERYRLMMILLLFACAWLGYTSCTRGQVRRFAYPWFGLLAAGAVFYASYKML